MIAQINKYLKIHGPHISVGQKHNEKGKKPCFDSLQYQTKHRWQLGVDEPVCTIIDEAESTSQLETGYVEIDVHQLALSEQPFIVWLLQDIHLRNTLVKPLYAVCSLVRPGGHH